MFYPQIGLSHNSDIYGFTFTAIVDTVSGNLLTVFVVTHLLFYNDYDEDTFYRNAYSGLS